MAKLNKILMVRLSGRDINLLDRTISKHNFATRSSYARKKLLDCIKEDLKHG